MFSPGKAGGGAGNAVRPPSSHAGGGVEGAAGVLAVTAAARESAEELIESANVCRAAGSFLLSEIWAERLCIRVIALCVTVVSLATAACRAERSVAIVSSS